MDPTNIWSYRPHPCPKMDQKWIKNGPKITNLILRAVTQCERAELHSATLLKQSNTDYFGRKLYFYALLVTRHCQYMN